MMHGLSDMCASMSISVVYNTHVYCLHDFLLCVIYVWKLSVIFDVCCICVLYMCVIFDVCCICLQPVCVVGCR